jgi:seryl-tRNA synthetase
MDVHLLRDPKTAELIRDSQRKRYKSVTLVDLVIKLDEAWQHVNHTVNVLRRELNALNDQIAAKHKAKEQPPAEWLEKQKILKSQVEKEDRMLIEARELRDSKLFQIGNLVHSSVPVSNDEIRNDLVRTWGTNRPNDEKTLPHHLLLFKIEGYEPVQGAAVAGHRGYFLKGPGVLLNQALINYGLSFLSQRNYTTLQTPYFMSKEVMAKTAQLADFDEQLYKVTGADDEKDKEKYLIATSEQPISAYHSGEVLTPEVLPKRYAGYSTNFRKEAGGHGRDAWGIFRVHQFEKIEQFVITEPEKSWEMHEDMLKASEEFYQSLGLAYRVVNIVSGELNDAASKKYDLEGWFPGLNNYRELVSCSNCTDYQSRRLDIQCGFKKDKDDTTKFVHMLNSTLCATTRTLCCILENYQREDGIEVPAVLQPFCNGLAFLPFKREVPKGMYEEEKKGGPSKKK